MNISISMLKDWLRCGQYAHNLHVSRRGPIERNVNLDVGILFHEGMALRPAAKVLPSTAIALNGSEWYEWNQLPSWNEVGEKAQQEWNKHRLWLPINAWVPDPQWELLEPEMKLQHPISPTGEHVLQGTLDRPVIWQDKLWSLQYKTYTEGSSPEWALLNLLEKVRLSFYEVAYQWLMERTICKDRGLPYGGVILGACAKLPGYQISAGRRAEISDQSRIDAFTFHHLKRSREQQDALWGDCWTQLMRAVTDLESGAPAKNLDSCFDYGRCPFFEVCHGAETLSDTRFVDKPGRY